MHRVRTWFRTVSLPLLLICVVAVPYTAGAEEVGVDSENAMSVVPLDDFTLDQVLGGQSAVDLFCSTEDIIQWSLTFPLTGNYTTLLLKCAASVGVDVIDMQVTEPLRSNVDYWLSTLSPDWVSPYRSYWEVDVIGYLEYIDYPSPGLLSLNVAGILEEYYCGYTNCLCDSWLDCYDGFCNEGFCEDPI